MIIGAKVLCFSSFLSARAGSGEKGEIFVKYAMIIYFCPAAEAG
jgi:hypothetical protein